MVGCYARNASGMCTASSPTGPILFFLVLLTTGKSTRVVATKTMHATFGRADARAFAQRYRPDVRAEDLLSCERALPAFKSEVKRYLRATTALDLNGRVFGLMQQRDEGSVLYVCCRASTRALSFSTASALTTQSELLCPAVYRGGATVVPHPPGNVVLVYTLLTDVQRRVPHSMLELAAQWYAAHHHGHEVRVVRALQSDLVVDTGA